jgi:hypothetical protein
MMHTAFSSPVPQRVALGLLLVAAVALGACRGGPGGNCAKPGLYTQAQSIAPLRIPAGLDAPDTRGALRVPDLNEPEAPRTANSPCLDLPPRYSNSARLEPPPRESASERRAREAAQPSIPAPAAPAPPVPPTTP